MLAQPFLPPQKSIDVYEIGLLCQIATRVMNSEHVRHNRWEFCKLLGSTWKRIIKSSHWWISL